MFRIWQFQIFQFDSTAGMYNMLRGEIQFDEAVDQYFAKQVVTEKYSYLNPINIDVYKFTHTFTFTGENL